MDGKIQKHEFLQPKTGLLAFVQERCVKTPEELRGGGVGPPPEVRKDKVGGIFGCFLFASVFFFCRDRQRYFPLEKKGNEKKILKE